MSFFCYHYAFSLLYYTPTNNNKASVDASTVSDTRNRDRYDELVEKKRKGEEEEIYEEQLAEMTVTLAIANDRLKNTPPDPTMDHLRALIKSKGTDPIIGRRK